MSKMQIRKTNNFFMSRTFEYMASSLASHTCTVEYRSAIENRSKPNLRFPIHV